MPVYIRVELMEQLVCSGARNPAVLAFAERFAPPWLGTIERLQALLDGMHSVVVYEPEPARADGTVIQEKLRQAITTLAEKRMGDCNNLSIAYAAMARALGFNAVATWVHQPGLPVDHVAAQVCLGGNPGDKAAARYDLTLTAPPSASCKLTWVWVETTLPGARVGAHPYDEAVRLGAISRTDLPPLAK